jgi:crotonobetaine/carnitine-CoA ligase
MSRAAASRWTTGDETTPTVIWDRALQKHPDATFVDFAGDTFTYAGFDAAAARMARGLRELGVGKGDTVASVLDNNADALLVWLATSKLGAVLAAVNTANRGEFLRHQLADSAAKVVLAEGDYVPRILEVESGLPDVQTVLSRSASGDLPSAERLVIAALDDHRLDGEDDVTAWDSRPGDLNCLIYTAGTTGPSKGCMLSNNYAVNLGRQTLHASGRRSDELAWTALPMFHFNALASTVIQTVLVGGACSVYPRFSVSNFWPEMERTGARMVNLLGAMIPLIGQMPETEEMVRCKGQIRIAMGAPFTAEMVAVWQERFGVERCGAPGYGTTEACMVTTAPLGAGPRGSSGRRNDDFEVLIVDADDRELPPGEAGEVIARPLKPHVMFEGFWRRPEATAEVSRNYWYHSGDIGRFDEDGWFYFVDRKKDYLRRRGENISSFEVESTFQLHPDVEEVVAHAVPSEFTEDDLKITVKLRAAATVTEAELCAWSVDRLPYFAVPRYVEFRSELPKNSVGRILKYQLRDDGRTPTTWDREESDLEIQRR